VERVLGKRGELGWDQTNLAELAAFIAYAQAFPDGFLALVDTYDTLQSGVPNYICVAAVLAEMGYQVPRAQKDAWCVCTF
jgi:nicotinate phosphoribosyltransferase